MLCRITDMHDKEVINVCNGCRLGCVDDVEIDTCTAQLCAIVIHGRPKALGLMGHEDDLIIPWKSIEIIGEETILVSLPGQGDLGKKLGTVFEGMLGGQ